MEFIFPIPSITITPPEEHHKPTTAEPVNMARDVEPEPVDANEVGFLEAVVTRHQ